MIDAVVLFWNDSFQCTVVFASAVYRDAMDGMSFRMEAFCPFSGMFFWHVQFLFVYGDSVK